MRVNEAIRANELRVIGPDGTQLGILSRADALMEAEKAGLDLVEISPQANPPVVRVIDWGKYLYQKTKEQQKSRKLAKSVEIKQIRIGLKIGSNDLNIKLRKIREFLEEGNKVKILVIYRGREMAHRELGFVLLDKVVEALGEAAVVEQQPILAGKNLAIVVRSTNAKAKNP